MEAGLVNSHSLTKEDLDFKCPREIRDRIATEVIDEWYLFGRALNVSEEKLTSISCSSSLSPEEKAVAALDAWAEEHGRGATCLKLVEALSRRKKRSVLEILCEEVTKIKGAGMAMSGQSDPNSTDNQGQKGGKTTQLVLCSVGHEYRNKVNTVGPYIV